MDSLSGMIGSPGAAAAAAFTMSTVLPFNRRRRLPPPLEIFRKHKCRAPAEESDSSLANSANKDVMSVLFKADFRKHNQHENTPRVAEPQVRIADMRRDQKD
jgi:hypothetical protein